jgi:hypothetical protein
LLDDFDEVGDEFLLDAVVACLPTCVPRTAPITETLVAALSLSEGLSDFSSSMYTVQSSSWLSSTLIIQILSNHQLKLWQAREDGSIVVAVGGVRIILIIMSRLPNYEQVSGFVRSSGGSRIASRVLLGASLISGVLGAYSYLQSFGAEKEIEFRKSQLKLPVYKLTEEQMVNPPWNHDNIDAWLYRRGNPSLTQSKSLAGPFIASPAMSRPRAWGSGAT